jgi:predicted DNA-binding transcriptional regulator YafY
MVAACRPTFSGRPYGGYRIGRGIRLPPLMFSAAEALGLVMAVLDGSYAAVSRPATAATAARSSGPPCTRNGTPIAASHSPAYIVRADGGNAANGRGR